MYMYTVKWYFILLEIDWEILCNIKSKIKQFFLFMMQYGTSNIFFL